MKTTKDYLLEMKERILKEGWDQGPDREKCCLIDYSFKVAHHPYHRYRIYDSLAAILDYRGQKVISIIKFNDDPNRTLSDIINLLDKAIENE